MRTILDCEGKLSRVQITRLGGLIALACGRRPYDHILLDLEGKGLIGEIGGEPQMNKLGRKELKRLTAMAGLRPEHYADSN